MSLINDALKRAKQSHGEAPAPAAPPEKTGFRPVESAPRKSSAAWLWLLIIVVLVGLGMFFIGQSTHKTVDASANTSPAVAPQPAEPKPAAVAQTPVPVAPKPTVAPQTSAPAMVQTSAVADAAPSVAPPAFKLQSIIYDPRQPSAMVNGKSLFVGDRISGFRVVAIRKDSVTLVGAGQTNVLELEN